MPLCLEITDEPNTSTGTEMEVKLDDDTGYMRLVRVNGWFVEHDGATEILNRLTLDFEKVQADGSTTTMTLDLDQASASGATAVMQTVNVPDGYTVIGWQQTKYSLVKPYYKGFFVFVADSDGGQSIQSHSMGANSERSVRFPGPIRGIRYKYGQVIESFQFIYDACYCDFEMLTPTAPISLLMGERSNVETTVPVSSLGANIFDTDEDACLRATQIELSGSSEIFTVTNQFEGTIFTEDGL